MPESRSARSARSSSGIDMLIVFNSYRLAVVKEVSLWKSVAACRQYSPERLILLDATDMFALVLEFGLLGGSARLRVRAVMLQDAPPVSG
jgi:hypothetical protein